MDPRHPHYYIRYRDKSSEITTYSCRHSSSHSDYLFRRCSNIGRDDLTHSWHFIYLNYWGKPVFSPHTIFYFFVSKIPFLFFYFFILTMRVITQQEIHIRSGSFEDCLNNASPAIIHPRVCGGGTQEPSQSQSVMLQSRTEMRVLDPNVVGSPFSVIFATPLFVLHEGPGPPFLNWKIKFQNRGEPYRKTPMTEHTWLHPVLPTHPPQRKKIYICLKRNQVR